MSVWHVITGEYPPQYGGVSDHSRLLAAGLAARGDRVHVWCPACPEPIVETPGVAVHRDLGKISTSDLRHVGAQLDRFDAPRHLLVQWVPHSYGWRSMNLAFCLWLWRRATRHGDTVEFVVHEPYLAFREGSWRQDAAAVIHRLMAIVLLRAAARVWVAIPEWERSWKPYAFGRDIPFQWLPVPSNIPETHNPARVQQIRNRYAPPGVLLIGHFGTYGELVASLLEPVLRGMQADLAGKTILLMGLGSVEFRKRFLESQPELENKIQATGPLTPEELSSHIAACDLLVQPYPDGVSCRRGSFMACLCHGKAIVTTSGRLTEPIWASVQAAAVAPAGDAAGFLRLVQQLSVDPAARERLEKTARKVYAERFDISHMLATFLGSNESECQKCAS